MEASPSSAAASSLAATAYAEAQPESLENIVNEMLLMEVAHQQALMIIVKEYLGPIRDAQPKVIDMEELRAVFNNVDQLLTFSIDFARHLQTLATNPTPPTHAREASDFIRFISERIRDAENCYQPYCERFVDARKKLEEKLSSSPLLKLYVETCYRESGCILELELLLILPLVRVIHLERVCMSLHSLAGLTPAAAFEKLRLLSTRAQLILKAYDSDRLLRVTSVRKSFGKDVDVNERVLVYEGTLQKVCRKTIEPRHFILCADALLYRNRILRVDTLSLNAMPESPVAFQIISEKKSFEVRAETPTKKAAWLAHLNYVIALGNTVLEPGNTDQAPVWVPDEEAEDCQICQGHFNVINRRHHCRYCGKVVCSKCSPNTIQLPAHKRRCRVCQPCFRQLQLLHSGGENSETNVRSSGSGKRLTLTSSNSNTLGGTSPQSASASSTHSSQDDSSGGSPGARRTSLRHYPSGVLEDRVLEARALYHAVQQARLSRRALLLRMQLVSTRVPLDKTSPWCKFTPSQVLLNARTTANTEPGELQRHLCIHNNYREVLQVRNCTNKTLTFNWKVLESHKMDTLEFAIHPRTGKIHEGETKEFAIGVRAMRSGSLNTLLPLVLEDTTSGGSSTEMTLHLRADFDIAGDLLLRYMLNEQLTAQELEQLQRFLTHYPVAAKHFQDKLHQYLLEKTMHRKESSSNLVTRLRSSSSDGKVDSSKALMASKYFLDFRLGRDNSQHLLELDTFQMAKDTLVLRNGTSKALKLSIDGSSVRGSHVVDFAPSQLTLEPGQTVKLLVSAVLLQPMTLERLFKLNVSDQESFVFAVRLVSRAWTTPEIEIPANQIQGGEIIGSGAAGVVLKTQLRGRVVAVKRFQISDADPQMVADFYREAKLLSMLRHPNICHLIGVCSKFPDLAVVMEFAPYGSLHSLLQNQEAVPQMDWRLKLKIAMDSARGCHYLHANQIIHRDLKSPNILIMSLDPSDSVTTAVVTDFNSSRVAASRGSQLTPNIGTLQWSAPEVLRGDDNTSKSDVFSFGIVLFEILTRGSPYPSEKFSYKVMDKVLQGMRPQIPSDCPPLYSKLMSACWAEKPSDRPSFADVLWTLTELRRTLLPPVAPAASSSGGPSTVVLSPLSLPSGAGPGAATVNEDDDPLPSPPNRSPLLLLREN